MEALKQQTEQLKIEAQVHRKKVSGKSISIL